MSRVLVTGGFVGGHALRRLLSDGHAARTTVRTEKKARAVRNAMSGTEGSARLEFVTADLAADQGWADAVRSCDFVLHVACPFPRSTIERMLKGAMPACPRVYFGVVDVRDVVELHIRAMTAPNAHGERFLAVADGCLSMLEVAKALHDRLGKAARRAVKCRTGSCAPLRFPSGSFAR